MSFTEFFFEGKKISYSLVRDRNCPKNTVLIVRVSPKQYEIYNTMVHLNGTYKYCDYLDTRKCIPIEVQKRLLRTIKLEKAIKWLFSGLELSEKEVIQALKS